MTANYPERRRELQGLMGRLGREIPGTMRGFAGLHEAATAAGALDAKSKELIALGIAVAVRCDSSSRFMSMPRSQPAPRERKCSMRLALPC